MASSGSNGHHLKYSAMEQGLLALLRNSESKRIDTDTLAQQYYKRRPPRNARQSVLATMRNLADKVRRNKEPFLVKRTARRGPHPVEFWLEEKR